MSSDIVEQRDGIVQQLETNAEHDFGSDRERHIEWAAKVLIEHHEATITALEAKLAEARAEAIEECAKVAEAMGNEWNPKRSNYDAVRRDEAHGIAKRIRNLADHTPDKEDDDAKG